MINFILCGHGSYGSSLKESLDMLLPEPADVKVIDFTKEMGASDLTLKVQKTLGEMADEPVLFICDMLGGAPFKTCAIEIIDFENKAVVAGINLTAIIEIYFQRDGNLNELVKTAVEVSREATDYFPK